MSEEYYNIGPRINDIDFYFGGVLAVAFSFPTSSAEVSVKAIRSVQSAVSISSSASSSSIKIMHASSVISSALDVSVSGVEILKTLIISHTTVSVSATIIKTAKASAIVSITTSPFANLTVIAKAHSHSDFTSSVQATGITVVKASANIHILKNIDFNAKKINITSAIIALVSKSNIKPPIRFSPFFIDYSSIKTLLILDGKPLSNHNRNFDVSLSPSFVENKNWNNKKNRYYKLASVSGRKTFNLSWSFLPNFMEKTVDSRHGRDFLAKISEDPDVHVLKIINNDEDGLTPYTETTYNVFIRSYSESLLRRDLIDDVYYFDCNLTLEEA